MRIKGRAVTQEQGGAVKYTISYPSGRTFTASGVFRMVPTPDGHIYPCVDQGASKEIILLDPRGDVRDDAGNVIYAGFPTWPGEVK